MATMAKVCCFVTNYIVKKAKVIVLVVKKYAVVVVKKVYGADGLLKDVHQLGCTLVLCDQRKYRCTMKGKEERFDVVVGLLWYRPLTKLYLLHVDEDWTYGYHAKSCFGYANAVVFTVNSYWA